jgi:arabinogalactan oligomer/maltooligosaccharide transport system permease protein
MRRVWGLIVALLVLALPRVAAAEPLRLWHAFRGKEEAALTELVNSWTDQSGVEVEVLALPHDSFAAKLEAAIPLGEGPHLFIYAHNNIGFFRERKVLAPVGDAFDADVYLDKARKAVTVDGVAYGVPLSQKCLALYYRTDLVTGPPETLEGMREVLRAPRGEGELLFAYATRDVYQHAVFVHAFGGRLLTEDDQFGFVGPEAEASVELVKRLADEGDVPQSADGALVKKLFAAGRVPFAFDGPWLASDLGDGVPYAVAPLPILEATGKPLAPLLTVESIMMSPLGAESAQAHDLARHLASREAGELRMRVARNVSARSDVKIPEDDAFVRAFAEQARRAVPMPTSVAMRAVWEPAKKGLRKALSGETPVDEALAEAKRRFDNVRRPLPPPRSPTPLLVVIGALCLLGAWQLVRRAQNPDFRAELRASVPAYKYVAHAVLAIGLLVFVPLIAGAAISLFAGPPGSQYYVGLANFVEILTARGGPLFASGSFYFVLAVTVLWTVVNLAFHLAIGMALGLLLSRPTLKLRGVYRVLLIVPWAVPSYVTALAWKGMFHQQFGAVTALINSANSILGLEIESIDWFARFSTAFAANAATNIWLGFPFMMVVTIAALTAVPKDVLEAAEVDGATRWQRFFLVTFPIIRPSMLPAAVLGAVWTFNMFNVVFLVSGGDPDGTTDILVSEAYRWAFTRQAQYGYAAAYAVLIFMLLYGVTRFGEWRAKRRPTAPEAEQPTVPDAAEVPA